MATKAPKASKAAASRPSAAKARKTGASKSLDAAKSVSAPAPAKRRNTDWDAVERDFRTGKFTLRELGDKYGISHAAIGKRSRDYKWVQDLGVAIRQATNARLTKELVSKEVSEGFQEVSNTVLAAAEVNTRVILKHRKDIEATRTVASELLAEVANGRLLAQEQELLAEILAGGVEGKPADPRRLADANRVIQKALDVANRVGSVKLLADTFTKLQAAERKAFGLSDSEDGDDKPLVIVKDLTGRKN
jgi:hypothetical protein